MKQCPQCGSTYTDDTLRFCLTDGAALEEHDPAKTEKFELEQTTAESSLKPTENARVRIDLPAREEDPYKSSRPPAVETTGTKKGVSWGVVAGIVAALLIVIGVLGSVIVYLAIQNGDQGSDVAAGENGSGEDMARLKDKIEEPGNRLGSNSNIEIDRNAATPTPAPSEEEEPEFDDEVIKRVNSPKDGFLALRDLPDTEKGSRIAKIPHGDIVVLGRCQTKAVKIGIRTGYWCRARWEGLEGWVFDVWLTD